MIVYNVTVNIEESIVDDWLYWIKKIHIPEVMKVGVFIKAQLNRVIVEGDTGETYAISYTCESMKELHHYQVNFAPELRKKHLERYGKKVVAFRTLLEVVKEY